MADLTPNPDLHALLDIKAERQKQIDQGYTPEHDDQHTTGDLIEAAECLLIAAQGDVGVARETWPWVDWQPNRLSDATPPAADDRRKLLVTSAALIVAEIGRIDRAAALDGAA